MALSNAQSWISRVDDSTKDTISGYIRNVQQMLPRNNSCFNIPFSIQYMILKYYWLKEYFVQIDHEDVEVNSKGNVVARRYDTENEDCCTVYGAMKVEVDKDYIYEWQVKILKLAQVNTACTLGIGLSSDNSFTKYCYLDKDGSNGFLIWDSGQLEISGSSRSSCPAIDEGDTVKLVVNTKSKECRVCINGGSWWRVNFRLKEDSYFAMCFWKSYAHKGATTVQLTHFACKQA